MADSVDGRDLLAQLYLARLDRLKELAAEHDFSKSGSVEKLRARAIEKLVLSDWNLDWSSLQGYSKQQLTQLLATFGIKRSGSIKEQRQRLWLHLNHDPKRLTLDNLDNLSRDELHDLCVHLSLPRSGSKSQLFGRVAGVIASQEKGWGRVKRSLRKGTANVSTPPRASIQIEAVKETPDPQPVEVIVEEVEPQPHREPVKKTTEPPYVPGSRTVTDIDEEADYNAIETEVKAFIDAKDGAWSDAEEAALYGELSRAGHPVHRSDVSKRLHELLEQGTEAPVIVEQPIQIPLTPADPIEQGALANLDSRTAELDHAIRDFLLDGSVNDHDDVEAFLKSLERMDIRVDMPLVRRQVIDRMNQFELKLEEERNSISTIPHSWRERQAIRRLEELRMHLLKGLENIFVENPRNLVKARMKFEEFASEQGLDLRLTSVSGRLHGLFDLHVSLNSHLLADDPRAPRREKALRILNYEVMDLSEDDRDTLQRVEQNIEGFEHIVEAILTRNPGEFNEDQQSLLIKFMKQRGYNVEGEEVQPRILAAAGLLGAEFGHIEIDKVPRVGPANLVSEAQVSSVVEELRNLADVMQSNRSIVEEEEEEPSVSNTYQNQLDNLKNKLDSADDLLNKIGNKGL